jgi:hypothetical protein
MAFLMAMASKTNVHGPGSYLQNTGFTQPGFPCMGAWISYALGSLTDNLPTFVVLPDHRGLPYNNTGNFGSGFLPAAHQGTIIKPAARRRSRTLTPPEGARHITAAERSAKGWRFLSNSIAASCLPHPGDSRLEARIGFVRAGRQDAAQRPGGARPFGETDAMQRLYGLDNETDRAASPAIA